MLENLLSTGKKRNDAAEGFKLALPDPPNTFLTLSDEPPEIAASSTRKILMPVHSGLLNQAKFLPLPFVGPLVIELDIISDPAEAFKKNAETDTTRWQLEDCYLLADSITLDNELQNQYSQAVLSGKNLPLHFSSYHTIMQGNPSQADTMTVLGTRGFTKLKTLFLTFFNTPPLTSWKRANYFYHPHRSYAYSAAHDNVSYFFQIGSKRYPESQVTSLAESFYRLRQAIGRHWGDSSIDIHPNQYSWSHFIAAQDLELMATSPGADDVAFTGANTTNGQIIQAELSGLQAGAQARAPTEVYLTMHHDVILNITSSGVDVLV
jgi:hypothetical protein